MTQASAQPEPTMADRLRGVVVRVRNDLEVTRHVFQNEPCYVVRDPVSFSTQRLGVGDYTLLIAIDQERPLGEAFDELVQQGELDPADEEDFYGFVIGLHRVGLLALPVGDHKSLYARYERRKKGQVVSRVMSPLFLRVPLWNPDGFLNRTIGLARWVFTPVGFGLWALLLLAAGAIAFVRRDELTAPLLTILELENVPLLWVILITLKLFHEFGHAYACKAFGGKVPEMGAFFIMGTPCAYVDATAAWGFGSVWKRMWVNLGGMYFELFCAAIGVIVWASTPPGLVNTAAYQVALMASIVTIGFNINPLAKFDGYYILGDLVGIPNLRQHAAAELKRVLTRVTLGLRSEPSGFGRVTRIGLVAFGVASAMYRTTVVIGLSAVLATKMFLVGLFVAAAFIGITLFGIITKLGRYLWFSEETAGVRVRAVALSVVLVAGTLSLVGFVPLSRPVRLVGTLGTEAEATVYAPESAHIGTIAVAEGDRVAAGDLLGELAQPDLALSAVEAAASEQALRIEHDLLVATDMAEARELRPQLAYAATTSRESIARVERLRLVSPVEGRVLQTSPELDPGGFVRAGEPLMRIGSGPWTVRLLLDEDAITRTDPRVGDAVACRSSVNPGVVLHGTVTSIASVGTRAIRDQAVTQVAGGPVTIDPNTNEAGQPYYEVTVRLDDNTAGIPAGATVEARLSAQAETISDTIIRRVRRFAAALETN